MPAQSFLVFFDWLKVACGALSSQPRYLIRPRRQRAAFAGLLLPFAAFWVIR
jgi:hypothetical protein